MKKAVDIIELTEAINMGDIPKHFRVAFDLRGNPQHPNTVAELLKGYLRGVQGISASKRVIIDWLGVARDAMLVMDAKKLLAANKGVLEQIPYDNPEALMADNMRLLHRIWQKKNYTRGVIRNLFEYAHAASKESYGDVFYQAQRIAFYQDLEYHYGDHPEDQIKLNSVKDAAKWVIRVLPKMIEKAEQSEWKSGAYEMKYIRDHLTEKDWIKLITAGLKKVGQVYGMEEEWIVHGDTLKIPRGSRIFALQYNRPSQEYIDKYRKGEKLPLIYIEDNVKSYLELEDIIKKLKKIYTVIHVDAKRFDDMKKRFFSKHGG